MSQEHVIYIVICATTMVTHLDGFYLEIINTRYVNDKKYTPTLDHYHWPLPPHVNESKHLQSFNQLIPYKGDLTAKSQTTKTRDIIKHYVNNQKNGRLNHNEKKKTSINGPTQNNSRGQVTRATLYLDLFNSTAAASSDLPRTLSLRSLNNASDRHMSISWTYKPNSNIISFSDYMNNKKTSIDDRSYLLVLPLQELDKNDKSNSSNSKVTHGIKIKNDSHDPNSGEKRTINTALEQNDITSYIHLQMRNLNRYIHEKLIDHLVHNKKHLHPQNHISSGKYDFSVKTMKNNIYHKLTAAKMFKVKQQEISERDQRSETPGSAGNKLHNNTKPHSQITVSKSSLNHTSKTTNINNVYQTSDTKPDINRTKANVNQGPRNFKLGRIKEFSFPSSHSHFNYKLSNTDHRRKDNTVLDDNVNRGLVNAQGSRGKQKLQKTYNSYFEQPHILENDRKNTKQLASDFHGQLQNKVSMQTERYSNNDKKNQDNAKDAYNFYELSTDSVPTQINKHEDEINLSFNDIVTTFLRSKQKKRTITRSDPNFSAVFSNSNNLKSININDLTNKEAQNPVDLTNNNRNTKLSVMLDYATVMLKRQILNRSKNSSSLSRRELVSDTTNKVDPPVKHTSNLCNDQTHTTYVAGKDRNPAGDHLNHLLFRPFKRKSKITGLVYKLVSNAEETNDDHTLRQIDGDYSDMSMLNLLLKALV